MTIDEGAAAKRPPPLRSCSIGDGPLARPRRPQSPSPQSPPSPSRSSSLPTLLAEPLAGDPQSSVQSISSPLAGDPQSSVQSFSSPSVEGCAVFAAERVTVALVDAASLDVALGVASGVASEACRPDVTSSVGAATSAPASARCRDRRARVVGGGQRDAYSGDDHERDDDDEQWCTSHGSSDRCAQGSR